MSLKNCLVLPPIYISNKLHSLLHPLNRPAAFSTLEAGGRFFRSVTGFSQLALMKFAPKNQKEKQRELWKTSLALNEEGSLS